MASLVRVRLRETSTETYDSICENNDHPDHRWRIDATIALAKWFEPIAIAADLSCGTGRILTEICWARKWFGDIALPESAAGPLNYLNGPIEETIHMIPDVDLFVCTETLEHLEDPDAVLREIRNRTRYLVTSVPVCGGPDLDPGHLWDWDVEGFGNMLDAAGFEMVCRTVLEMPPPYFNCQIWGCR